MDRKVLVCGLIGICMFVLVPTTLGENRAEMVPEVLEEQGGKFPSAVVPNTPDDIPPSSSNTIFGISRASARSCRRCGGKCNKYMCCNDGYPYCCTVRGICRCCR